MSVFRSTFPQSADDGDGDEESDKLNCPPNTRDAIDTVQLRLLPASKWRAVERSAASCRPTRVRVARTI